MHHDDPGEAAGDLVTSALFGDHGLGRPVIGSAHSITALRRNQVDAYWRRHYRPTEIVVAAAGAVDHDRLVDQLGSFAGFAGDHGRGPRRVPRPPRRHRASAAARRSSPPSATPRRSRRSSRPAARACSTTAGTPSVCCPWCSVAGCRRGCSSRSGSAAGWRTRSRRGRASTATPGLFSIDWQCAPERLTDILDVVRQVTGELADAGIDDRELARAKTQLRGQTILGYEGPNSRMSRLGGEHGERRASAAWRSTWTATTRSPPSRCRRWRSSCSWPARCSVWSVPRCRGDSWRRSSPAGDQDRPHSAAGRLSRR